MPIVTPYPVFATPVAPPGTLSFDVTDEDNGVSGCLVLADQAGRREVVYDGTTFLAPYSGTKVELSPTHWRFQVRRAAGGWIDPVVFYVLSDPLAPTGGPPTYADIKAACAGADSPLSIGSQTMSGGDPAADSDFATRGWVTAALATVGGAPARIVPLDANDIAEWKLDDAAEPWLDTLGGPSITSYPGYPSRVIEGGSIHGTRCAFVDYAADSGLLSDDTTTGQVAAGTVHGWFKPTRNGQLGTIVAKDLEPYEYARVGLTLSSDQLYGRVGDSGDIGLGVSYNGLVNFGEWNHAAITWDSGVGRFYVNGTLIPTPANYSAISWLGKKWTIGYSYGWGRFTGCYSSWRLCNVARSAAYLNEVYRRAIGRYP